MTRFTLAITLLVAANAAAEMEIHRCLLDDGTFAFQELPCQEPVESAVDDSESGEDSNPDEMPDDDNKVLEFVNPYDEPLNLPATTESSLPESISGDRAVCEKTTRDAIDTIDLRMRQNPYTKEQGQEFLSELRVLTQQLRACKRL